MANKTTDQIEQEMLEQTFNNFETEMPDDDTSATAATQSAAKKPEVKKSSKQNIIIIGGVVFVAILYFVWQFLLAPMFSTKPAPIPVKPSNPVTPPVVNEQVTEAPVNNNQVNNTTVDNNATAPVVDPSVQPVPVIGDPNAVIGAPVDPTLSSVPNVTNGVDIKIDPSVVIDPTKQGSPVVDLSTIQQTPNLNVELTPQLPTVTTDVNSTPVVAPVNSAVTPVAPVTPTNGSLTDDMKQYLENKFSNIDVRFDQTNASISAIEQRVSKLENGKVSVSSNVSTNQSVNVAKPKKVYKKKVVKPMHKPEKTTLHNDSVVDMSDKRSDDQLLIVNKKEMPTKATVSKIPLSDKYKIHSLYAGRLWLLNEDNTHSSYSVGDRLPDGEKIKSIDMDKKTIETDAGDIKAK